MHYEHCQLTSCQKEVGYWLESSGAEEDMGWTQLNLCS